MGVGGPPRKLLMSSMSASTHPRLNRKITTAKLNNATGISCTPISLLTYQVFVPAAVEAVG